MNIRYTKNEKVIFINNNSKFTSNNLYIIITIIITKYINYCYRNSYCIYNIYYNNCGYAYSKKFSIQYDSSNYSMIKKNRDKFIIFHIPTKKYNILYSYFIYNKYYSNFKSKLYDLYFNINSLIHLKKLFNCRDYYRIYSYI